MVDLELYQCSIFDELFEKKVITKKIMSKLLKIM